MCPTVGDPKADAAVHRSASLAQFQRSCANKSVERAAEVEGPDARGARVTSAELKWQSSPPAGAQVTLTQPHNQHPAANT